MANRRMFAKTIIENDDFLDMGATARLLYYDLGVQADDDGFVQPKRVMRMTGASADDLKVLITKGFVIPMEDGVLVIRDWLINNEIRQDRYKETIFQDQKKQLFLTKGKQYTLGSTNGNTDGMRRIEEYRLEENNNTSFKKKKPFYMGMPMRNTFGKWEVSRQGEWTKFVGKESEIEWK